MTSIETPTLSESVAIAQTLANCDEAQRAELVHELRRTVRLSRTVRGLNRLIEQPAHRPLGEKALRSIGLHLPG